MPCSSLATALVEARASYGKELIELCIPTSNQEWREECREAAGLGLASTQGGDVYGSARFRMSLPREQDLAGVCEQRDREDA